MDIHRSRFVPYPPSAINALAFSYPAPIHSKDDPRCLRLAIGRANGNIEIWNPAQGAWLQERVFMGGKDRSVEGLVWIQERDRVDGRGRTELGKLRLFSIGYSSAITEWDLVSGTPARHSDGNHSEVWCFAAQPAPEVTNRGNNTYEDVYNQELVAGCADGSLVLFSTVDNDLKFDRFLSRPSTKKARVLSVCYQNRNTVIAGFADSTIRVFDTEKRVNIRTISMGTGNLGGPKEVLVWKVKCFRDGNFVSGDSTGDIRFYDGKNYSEVQRISGHEADVLDLAVSQDGMSVFSGGMDRRTCYYTLANKKGKRNQTWRKVSHQRYHEHDVKALATYEGSKLNIVVSGGIDAQPIVLPLRNYGKELSRGLSLLPRTPALISAPDARYVVSWWNCEVRIWRVKTRSDSTERPKVIARLALQGDENITSATITKDGGLLAVSTPAEVKLFQLTEPSPASGGKLRIKKINVPAIMGARLVRFTWNGKWLAIVSGIDDIKVARVVTDDSSSGQSRVLEHYFSLKRLERLPPKRDPLNQSGRFYARTITHAEFSTDGSCLAVADLEGHIDTWLIEGHEDSTSPELDVAETASSSAEEDSDNEQGKAVTTTFGQRWVRNPAAQWFPQLDSSPLLLSFEPAAPAASSTEPNGNPAVHPTRHNPHPHSHDLPTTEQHLAIVSSDHRIYHFQVLAGKLSDWSRRNPVASYPPKFRLIDDPTKGCVWDVSGQNRRLWLHGEKWLFMFDLNKDLPLPKTEGAEYERLLAVASKKRKRLAATEPVWQSTSGAGDVMSEKVASVPKMRRLSMSQGNKASADWVDMDNENGKQETEDEEMDDAQEALVALRRSDGDTTNGHAEDEAGQEVEVAALGADEDNGRSGEASWHTFKYRPILGIVPVGTGSDSLEVVLVERPAWDLDLPPRFVGVHE